MPHSRHSTRYDRSVLPPKNCGGDQVTVADIWSLDFSLRFSGADGGSGKMQEVSLLLDTMDKMCSDF